MQRLFMCNIETCSTLHAIDLCHSIDPPLVKCAPTDHKIFLGHILSTDILPKHQKGKCVLSCWSWGSFWNMRILYRCHFKMERRTYYTVDQETDLWHNIDRAFAEEHQQWLLQKFNLKKKSTSQQRTHTSSLLKFSERDRGDLFFRHFKQ